MIVWWNGRYCALEDVSIHPFDRGFLFGDGLFETVRLHHGVPLWLSAHLRRLREGLRHFNLGELSDFFSNEGEIRHIISGLVSHNPSLGNVARLKIIVTRGQAPSLGLPTPEVPHYSRGKAMGTATPTILLFALPYTPPSEELYRNGVRLYRLPGRYAPPLGRYKTLNYLFFLWAKEEAVQHGADEAVIEDVHGSIAEASTASLAAFLEGKWIFPESPWKLWGTTEEILSPILLRAGYALCRRPLTYHEMRSCDAIWLLNSLLGIMPVAQLDDHPLPTTMADEAARLRQQLFASP